MSKLNIDIQAKVDRKRSIDGINKSIENIGKSVKPLSIGVEVDNASIKKIEEQLKDLTSKVQSNGSKVAKDVSGVFDGTAKSIDNMVHKISKLDKFENLGKVPSLNMDNNKQLEALSLQYSDVDAKVKNLKKTTDAYGNTVATITTVTGQQTGQLKEEQFVIDEITGSIYRKNQAYKENTSVINKTNKELEQFYHMHEMLADRQINENLTLEENSKAIEKLINQKSKLQQLGTVDGVNNLDEAQVTNIAKSYLDADASIQQISKSYDTLGNSVFKVTATMEEGSNHIRTQKLEIDGFSDTVYKQSDSIKSMADNTNASLTSGKSVIDDYAMSFSNMAENVFKFMTVQSLISKAFSELRGGVQFIKDLDNDLMQVRMVTGKTAEETEVLTDKYATLSDELKISLSELSQTSVDLYRQGLDDNQVEDRLRVISQTAKTTALDIGMVTDFITAGVNATGVEAEKYSDVLVKAGAIAGTSFQELGEGMAKVVSTASVSGIEVEKLTSYIATMSETTRESARSLGTSMKSVIARFNKINEETGESNDAFNDVQTAIESVGIAFLDLDEQVRPVSDILDDLALIWDDLDKNTKNYISTQVGGTQQISRFQALMENYNRSLEINNQLMSAGGTLQEQYSVYLQSVEASAQQVKASLEQMWKNTIDSGHIKGFLDFTNVLIKIVDKIGLVNVALIGLNFTVLKNSQSAQNFINILATGKDIDKYIASTKFVMGETFKAIKMGFVEAKAGAGGLTGMMTALNGVLDITIVKQALLTAGISVLVGLAMAGIGKIIGKLVNVNDESEQLMQTLAHDLSQSENDYSSIDALSGRFEELHKLQEEGVDVAEELNQVQRELVEVYPELANAIDDEGQAIATNLEQVLELAETKRDIYEQELEMASEEAERNRESLEEERDRIEEKIRYLNEQKFAKEDADSSRQDYLLSDEKIEEGLQIQLDKLKDVNIQLSKSNEIIQQRELYESNAKRTALELAYAKAQTVEEQKKITDEAKELGVELRNVNEATNHNLQAISTATDKLNDFKEILSKMDKGNMDMKEWNEMIAKYPQLLDYINDETKMREYLKDAISQQEASYSSARDTFEEITKSVQFYNQVLDELNSKEGLSADLKEEIILKHQELLPYLHDEAEMRDFLKQKIKEEEEAQLEAYSNMIDYSNDFYNVKILGNQDLVNQMADMYQIDLTNFKNLAEAKAYVEAELIKTLSSNWANYLNATKKSLSDVSAQMKRESKQQRGANTPSYSPLGDNYNSTGGNGTMAYDSSIRDAVKQYDAIISTLDNFKTPNIKKFSANGINMKKASAGGGSGSRPKTSGSRSPSRSGGSGGRAGSKSKGSTSRADEPRRIESIDAEVRAIKVKNKALKDTNDLLAKERSEIKARDVEGSQVFKQTLDYYKSLGKALENNKKLEASYEDEKIAFNKKAIALRKANKKYSTEKWFDANSEQTVAYINEYNKATKSQQDEMDKLFNKLQKLKKGWQDSNKEVKNVQQSTKELTRELEKQSKELKNHVKMVIEKEKELAYSQLEAKQRAEREKFDAEKKRIKEKEKQAQAKIDQLQKEIKDIQDSEKARKDAKELAEKVDNLNKLKNKYDALINKDLASLSSEQAKLLGLEQERAKAIEFQEKKKENLVKLAEMELKLLNTRKNLNIQQLKKNNDGSWEFQYVADEREIKKQSQQIDKFKEQMLKDEERYNDDLLKQKESLYEQLKKMQEDFDEYIRQKAIEDEIDRKQKEIDKYNSELQALKDALSEKEEASNDYYDKQKESLDRYYSDMDGLTNAKFEDLYNTFDGNWDKIVENLTSHFDRIDEAYKDLLSSFANSYIEADLPDGFNDFSKLNPKKETTDKGKEISDNAVKEGWGIGKGTTNDPNKIKELKKKLENEDYVQSEIDRANTVIANRKKAGMDTSAQEKYLDSLKKKQNKFESGGETNVTGVHWLDGKIGKPERVLSAEQTKAFNKLVDMLPSLLSSQNVDLFNKTDILYKHLNAPNSANSNGSTIKQQVIVENIDFPDVSNADEIKGAIESLSTYAEQWANLK